MNAGINELKTLTLCEYKCTFDGTKFKSKSMVQ